MDQQLIHPVIRALSLEVQLLDAALLVDNATHAALTQYVSPSSQGLRYSWREFLDPERINDRTLATLATDFRRLLVTYPSANITPSTDTALRTGMAAILEAHQVRWAAAEGIIAVMAVGPALVAVATLALIAVLAARRRQATMTLARSRGASGRQVLVPAVVEGLLIAVPGAAIAVLIAVALIPGGLVSPTLAGVAGVVALAVIVVTSTVVSIVRSRGPGQRDDDRVVRRVSARRLLLEGLIVAGAVGAAWLLRERGLKAVSSAGAVGGFDPLIAAVPVLVGIAAGIVVVRALPVRAAGRGRGRPSRSRPRAGPGGTAGDRRRHVIRRPARAAGDGDRRRVRRRVARRPRSGRGRRRLAGRGGQLPPADVERLASARPRRGRAPGRDRRGRRVRGQRADQRRGTADPVRPARRRARWPPRWRARPPTRGSPTASRRPARVRSPRSSRRPSPRRPAARSWVTCSPAASRASPSSTRWWRCATRSPVCRSTGRGSSRRASGSQVQAPEARIAPGVGDGERADDLARGHACGRDGHVASAVVTTSQAEEADALRESPVTQAVRGVILAAALVTAAYAALGVAAALALSGIARSVEVARLRTLGLTGTPGHRARRRRARPDDAHRVRRRRPARGRAVRTARGRRSASGGSSGRPVDVPLALQAGPLLLILAGMIAVVAIGLALGAAFQRRVAPAAAIRGRFE